MGVRLPTPAGSVSCQQRVAHRQAPPFPAVILAAGQGHRLLENSGGLPKPLVPLLGCSLLERAVHACKQAGITEVYIVIGYRSEQMHAPIAALAQQYHLTIHAVVNPQWHQGNGGSASAVEPYLKEPFFLLMGDHVFDATILGSLRGVDDGSAVCRLAVDRRIDTIFDLPDATKVRLQGLTVTAIGKDIMPFDAIDTGLFLCRPLLFSALAQSQRLGDGSLSGGMRQLLDTAQLQAMDIGSRLWSDVDTPASLTHTERLLQGE